MLIIRSKLSNIHYIHLTPYTLTPFWDDWIYKTTKIIQGDKNIYQSNRVRVKRVIVKIPAAYI